MDSVLDKDVLGRRFVTAQRLTNTKFVENKMNFGNVIAIQGVSHTQTHIHTAMDGEDTSIPKV